MQMVMIGFDDRQAAKATFDELEDVCDDRDVRLRELAVVYRSGSGRSRVRQSAHAGSGPTLVQGGLLGLLVAIGGPVGSAAAPRVGGALGGVIAGVGSSGIDNPMMRALAGTVHDHEGAVLVLGEKAQLRQLSDVLGPYRDVARCVEVPAATQNLIRVLSKLSMEDLESD